MTDITLLSCLDFVKKNGVMYKSSKWCSDNPLMKVFNYDLPRCLEALLSKKLGDNNHYKITARSGSSGSWSSVMYVAFLDKNISRSLNGYTSSTGIYPIILVSPDCQHFYLSYMVAVGNKNERQLKKIVLPIRNILGLSPQSTDVDAMDLGKDRHKYRDATIFFKELMVERYSNDNQIVDEIFSLFEMHEVFLKSGLDYTNKNNY